MLYKYCHAAKELQITQKVYPQGHSVPLCLCVCPLGFRASSFFIEWVGERQFARTLQATDRNRHSMICQVLLTVKSLKIPSNKKGAEEKNTLIEKLVFNCPDSTYEYKPD